MPNEKSVDKLLGDLVNIKCKFVFKSGSCTICGFPFEVAVRKKAIKQAKLSLLELIEKESKGHKTFVYMSDIRKLFKEV
jgi:uncharacterized Fe-S cluster-containing MiaB family protein